VRRNEGADVPKDYLVGCCSCEEWFVPDLEALRGVCLQCNKAICADCILTNPREWQGLCAFCVPEEARLDPTVGLEPWKEYNRKRSEQKEKSAAWQAEDKKRKLTGRPRK
jgi:hypothetical protein